MSSKRKNDTINHQALTFILAFLTLFLAIGVSAQNLYDPCFNSIHKLKYFDQSDYVKNVCGCMDDTLGGNMLQWNPTTNQWDGILENTMVDRPAPNDMGCNSKAVWIGCDDWNEGGEGLALKFYPPLEEGKEYSFTMTYASDGVCESYQFSPDFSTGFGPASMHKSSNVFVAHFPQTLDWVTNTVTFKATRRQTGHEWLIIGTFYYSGLLLSDCRITQDTLIDRSSLKDTVCLGESVKLEIEPKTDYSFKWDDGSDALIRNVTQPGLYLVSASYNTCTAKDSVVVSFKDCETRMKLPNVFTPNGDPENEKFLPIEYNYILKADIKIMNRWGLEVFHGDLLKGWSGVDNNGNPVSMGTYYYELVYVDGRQKSYFVRDLITLFR